MDHYDDAVRSGFTALFKWHFRNGTRPIGPRQQGHWTPTEFANALGGRESDLKSVRNWLKGTKPKNLKPIERVFFGNKPSGSADPYEKWRDDLQYAHAKAWEQHGPKYESFDELVLDDPRAEGRYLRATAGFAESLIANVQQDRFRERATDLEFLDRFLRSGAANEASRQFRWALVTGPAGAGKTRLAIHFLKSAEKHDFRVGFLKLENLRDFDACAWRPSRSTFAVIDYAAESPDPVAKMLKAFTATVCGAGFGHPVRVLLLEREAIGDWFKTIAPMDSIGALVRSFCYREDEARWDHPLTSLPSRALLAIMRGRLPNRGTELSNELLLETLGRIDPPSDEEDWRSTPRPLFAAATAMMIADMMKSGDDTEMVVSNLRAHSDEIELPSRRRGRVWRGHPRLRYTAPAANTKAAETHRSTTPQTWIDIPTNRYRLSKLERNDVLAWIIDRERAHFWFGGDTSDHRAERQRLRIHENLLLVATMALDLSRQRYDNECPDGLHEYLPGAETLDEDRFRRMSGGNPVVKLKRLEPDILGEFFVLDRLKGLPARERQSLVNAALALGGMESAVFLVRCAMDFGDEWRGLGFLRPSSPGPAMIAFARSVVGCAYYLGKDRLDDITTAISVVRELADNHSDPLLSESLGYSLLGKGFTLSKIGRNEEAIAAYDELITGYGTSSGLPINQLVADALISKGITLGELGRSEEAITVYDDVVSRYGTSSEPTLRDRVAKALYNTGVTLGELGRSEEAIAVYDDVISRYGTACELTQRERVADALVSKGGRLGELGRSKEAIAVYDDVVSRYGAASELTLRERVAKALVNKGVTLGELGRSEEAITVYDDVINRYGTASELTLRERVARALANKGDALGKLGRNEEAIAVCDDVVSRYGAASELTLRERVVAALYNKGVTLGELGRSEEAIAIYDDVVSRYGTASELTLREQLATALYNKGVTLGELGRSEEAIAVYDDVVSRYGTASELVLREHVAKALVNKEGALGKLRRNEEAIAVCDDVVRRYGTANELTLCEQVAKAHLNKGRRLGEMGRRDDELAVYDDMIQTFRASTHQVLQRLITNAISRRYGNLSRNQKCPCGSNKRFKHCHGSFI